MRCARGAVGLEAQRDRRCTSGHDPLARSSLAEAFSFRNDRRFGCCVIFERADAGSESTAHPVSRQRTTPPSTSH